MTQQYVIGEFSWLLASFQPPPNEVLQTTARSLRREVECGPSRELRGLARQAVTLADMICAAALESGDVDRFCHYVAGASALGEFLVSANLLQ
jgi:hypothetical protein